MNKLLKFLSLDPFDRHLLFLAVTVQAMIQTGLCLLPFQVVLKILAAPGPADRSQGVKRPDFPEKCAWAIRVSSRIVPGSRCLCQALAGKFLLARSGFISEVRLGVMKEDADLKAHAWLERDGNILIGNLQDLCAFTPLPDLPWKGRGRR